ncbi:hypothetical protein Tco_0243204 [Tanacetum coccineum]
MAVGIKILFISKKAQRKTKQSLYNGKVLLEKHDPPVVHDSEETLQLAQESRQKMKQLNKEIKPANYTKINHLSGIFVSQRPSQQEAGESEQRYECEYSSLQSNVKLGHFKPRFFLRESTVVNNERVIAPGIFRINPFKANRVDNFVPNKHVKTSVRTKPIIVSQPHDDCVRQYVNGMSSRKKNQSANVSKSANQKTHKAQVWKPKNVGSKERFASPKPSKPRSCLRWSPTGRFFDLKGKIIASSKSESQSDCSKGDNACTSNPQEPINKRFPSSTFSMTDNNPFFKEKENIATRSSKKKGSVRFSALYLKKKRNLLVFTSVDMIVMTSMVELESLFGHLIDELSNGENQVVTKSSAVTTADASDKCQQQQDSTSSTSTLATTISADGNFDL